MDVRNFIEEFNERARKGLAAAPEVAVLVPGSSPDPSDQPLAGDEHVCGVAVVTYSLAPHWLLILRIPARDGAGIESHARQIQILEGYISRKIQLDDRIQKPQVWPLHMLELSQAILSQQARISGQLSVRNHCENVMRVLAVSPPRHDGDLIAALRDHFGENVGLTFSMSFFYAQSLWVLAPFCLALVILGLVTDAGAAKARLYIGQAVVVLWAVFVAYFGLKRFVPTERSALNSRCQTMRVGIGRRSQRSRSERTLKFVFVALPLMALLLLCVFIAFASVTLLILYVIYKWGDCLNEVYNPPFTETVCRDPQVKHGFVLGLLAELSCDILLVIIFEIFLPVCEQLGDYIAGLRNHDHESDRRVLANAITFFFAAVESLGFRVCLAFVFVPQWNDPAMSADEAKSLICNFPYLNLWCTLQSNLDVETRRFVLEKLLKGPFCVAPFIRILMKVIIPKLADWLSRFLRRHQALKRTVVCKPCFWFSRLLALIFAYEGDHVECFRFLSRGWPFSGLQVKQAYCAPATTEDSPATGIPTPQALEAKAEEGGCDDENAKLEKTENRMQEAMEQFVAKRLEPDAELLELKLSFLGVIFFGPVMPLGILFTLLAMVLEIRTDLIKMLFVRRRTAPDTCTYISKDFIYFLVASVVCSVGWHLGLALITYNDALWRWATWGKVLTAGLGVWVLVSLGLNSILIDMHRKPATGRDSAEGEATI